MYRSRKHWATAKPCVIQRSRGKIHCDSCIRLSREQFRPFTINAGEPEAKVEPDSPADSKCPPPDEDWPDKYRQRYGVKVLKYQDYIHQAAIETCLDPLLISAVILQESGGEPDIISSSGAVGLMQIMPRDGAATKFMCINGPCFADRPTTHELKDPKFNVEYGSRMLANLLKKYGNMRDALFRYGPMGMGYHYADLVIKIYENVKN